MLIQDGIILTGIFSTVHEANAVIVFFTLFTCGIRASQLPKWTVLRDFLTLVSFHQTTSSGPNKHASKKVRILSNIRGVICIRNLKTYLGIFKGYPTHTIFLIFLVMRKITNTYKSLERFLSEAPAWQ
jgi:hypothetical protein